MRKIYQALFSDGSIKEVAKLEDIERTDHHIGTTTVNKYDPYEFQDIMRDEAENFEEIYNEKMKTHGGQEFCEFRTWDGWMEEFRIYLDGVDY